MLTKRRLEDGGMDVETGLFGPAVLLDVWAVRDLAGVALTDLRDRFAKALSAARGSLLVSTAWSTELETLQGDARTRAQALFTSLGAHWLLINPIVSAVAAREARDELGAYLSDASLRAYVLERTGELLRSDTNPHSLSDIEFFDLARTLEWTAADPGAAATAGAQSQALKEAAKTRTLTETNSGETVAPISACTHLFPSRRAEWRASTTLCGGKSHEGAWSERGCGTTDSTSRIWSPR